MKKIKPISIFTIIVFIFNLVSSSVVSYSLTDSESPIISKVENPVEGHQLTDSFLIKGYAVSTNGVSQVEIFIDNVKFATATYGLERSDVEALYPNYPNSKNSGFKYTFKNVADGNHIIKVRVVDTKGNIKDTTINITTSSKKTEIMGKGSLNRNQMINILTKNNPNLDYKYIANFVDTTIKEANDEGINYDILYAQMLHETGYLKFGGDVQASQNNFSGLGATGNGNPGLSFPTVEIGIRATAQHLKAYASTETPNKEIVDPRFNYVTRGTAVYLEYLGIPENPNGLGWAAARNYGYRILGIINEIKTMPSTVNFSVLNDVSILGKLATGNKITVNVTAEPQNDTLYRIWLCNRDDNPNTWTLLSDYSAKSTIDFTPTKAGNYTLVVHAKNKNSTTTTQDDLISKDFKVVPGISMVSELNVTGDAIVNGKLTITSKATPEVDTLYRIWVADRSTDTWTLLSDYSTKTTVDFVPKKTGTYSFVVHVKHKESPTKTQDDYKSVDVNVTLPKSTVKSLNITGNKIVNENLTVITTGAPETDTLYRIWVADRSTDTWTLLSDYSTKSTVDFVPKKPGTYSFVVHAKHKNSNTNTQDDYKSVDVNVTFPKSTVTSLNVAGNKIVNNSLTVSAIGTPETDTLYRIWVADRSTDTWTLLSDYSTRSSVDFVPKKPGTYSFVVHAKHKNSSTKTQDDYKSVDVKITEQKSTVESLNITGNINVNQTITMTATSTEPNTLYKLWVCDRTTGVWTVLSDYSTKATADFVPKKAGTYSLVVHVKNKNSSSTTQDDYKSVDINVTTPKSTVKSLTLSGNSINEEITMTATATPEADTLYKLWVYDRTTGIWTVLSDYSPNNTAKFKTTKKGYYSFVVHVKSKYSNSSIQEDYSSKDVFIGEKNKATAISLGISGTLKVGNAISIQALAEPQEEALYRIWICDRKTEQWTLLSDYSSNRIASYIPATSGNYSVVVHVKHKNSTTTTQDEYISKDINVLPAKTLIVIDPGHNYGGDYGAVATHNGISYKETEINMQIASKLKKELVSRGYEVVLTREENDRDVIAMRESLKARVNLANSLNANLFISIHQNSFTDSSTNGVEVYYSSETPSNIDGVSLTGESISLLPTNNLVSRATSKVTESKKLAENIVNNIASQLGYRNRGALDDSFYVVKNTTMPSVLVECGFISNPTQAASLVNENNQLKIIKAIADQVQKQF